MIQVTAFTVDVILAGVTFSSITWNSVQKSIAGAEGAGRRAQVVFSRGHHL
jgi:hypothetical protein